MIDEDLFARNLSTVREDIAREGREDVTIVAVTKGFGASAIELAARHGLHAVGENYAQEMLEKVVDLDSDPDLEVHFIGRVQRNKVRKVAPHVTLWQSVARPEILEEISRRCASPSVLIQVRPGDDDSKDGVEPEQVGPMLEMASELGVTVEGLMTIGVLGDPEATRLAFSEVDDLALKFGLTERSMGMSGDYLDALRAGSTMLRLGSQLFGPRPAR